MTQRTWGNRFDWVEGNRRTLELEEFGEEEEKSREEKDDWRGTESGVGGGDIWGCATTPNLLGRGGIERGRRDEDKGFVFGKTCGEDNFWRRGERGG